jgi:hypothetical protein
MSTAFNALILVLGIIEIIFAFNMEKFTRSKYKGVNVRDLQGLIKWEKTTTLVLGILLIILAAISFVGEYEKYSTYFIGIMLVVMVVTFLGRKRYTQ